MTSPDSRDPRPVRLAKRLTPRLLKNAAEAGIRQTTRATSGLRPAPDFLVVGTKRGGTTSLWQTLLEHPQVMAMVPAAKHLKSPHYFYRHYDKGLGWYLGHFPTRGARRRHATRHGKALAGEASPMYLFDPRVPARVRADLPHVKIIVLLRDPVERALSHWKERVKNRVETLSFAEALAAEPGRLAGEWERILDEEFTESHALDWYSYRSRGEYAGQVARWLEHFPRQQVLILRSEDFYADQTTVVREVEHFLGLDHHLARDPVWRHRMQRHDVPEAVLRELRAHFVRHNEELAELLSTTTWWPDGHQSPTQHRQKQENDHAQNT